MNPENIKTIVKEKYGRIALQSDSANPSGCGDTHSGCCNVDYTVFSENYESQEGYNKSADLGLGCGIPTEFAGLKPGQHVLDLGSGAGNDCFVARAIVGITGKVTGLDFSENMLAKARRNVEKMGYENVKFVAGEIEDMPLDDNQFDVVISNCVINLVPDKKKAFNEILRVLKPGGRFCISDVVIQGELPEKLRVDAEMYAGCVSGALQLEDYQKIIQEAGFQHIKLHKQHRIAIPEDILKNYLKGSELLDFQKGSTGIFSITVSAEKPS